MTDTPPQVPIDSRRQSILQRASIVWIIPLGALAIALGVAWNAWMERGPLIQISFENAAGVHANETDVRFRDVSVGVVEHVSFTDGLDRVLVDVRLDKDVAPFVDEDATFWIVRPELSAAGVSGLDTVFSGVYINGAWDSEIGQAASRFEGLEQVPIYAPTARGLRFELRSAEQAGLRNNTPILYKGIEVGRIGNTRISDDGQWIFADAIIFDPHDKLVTTATRFWDTSGFSLNLGPNGAELNFSSVATVVAGGITFDTIVSGGEPARDGLVYELFPSQSAARTSVFEANDGSAITLSAVFSENISGLAAGSAVEWRGVRVGEVLNVTGLIDEERFGDRRVRLLATMEVFPGRFGLQGEVSEDQALDFIADRVVEGLRVRLATASIITGGLKVEFVLEDNPETAGVVLEDGAFPQLPVTDAAISDVSASAEGVLARVSSLPIEELLRSAIDFLNSGTAFVTSDELREAPAELRGLLADARDVIGSDEVQAIPGDISSALGDFRAVAADLRTIISSFEEADAVGRLLAAVDAAGSAAAAAEATLSDVPEITGRLQALLDKANGLPVDALVLEVTALIEDARDLVASDSAQVLPGQVSDALASLNEILTDINESGATGQLTAALAAANSAAQGFEASIQGLPDIIARVESIAENIDNLPLEQVTRDISDLVASTNRLIADASAERLPAALAGALSEVEAALADLNEAGIVDSASATLAAAERAAAAVETAAENLPALVNRANAAILQAETTLQSFETNSPFGREVRAALRDVQAASDAVASLARALERRPNSILLGR